MTETVVRLSFPAKTDYLLLARLALSGMLRTVEVDDEQSADLKLAVTEACGNAVRHAYPAELGQVGVTYVLEDDRIVMIVEDQGAGVGDVVTVTDTDTDESEEPLRPLESGMGMSIIRTIMDELEVSPGADGSGTRVRMTATLR